MALHLTMVCFLCAATHKDPLSSPLPPPTSSLTAHLLLRTSLLSLDRLPSSSPHPALHQATAAVLLDSPWSIPCNRLWASHIPKCRGCIEALLEIGGKEREASSALAGPCARLVSMKRLLACQGAHEGAHRAIHDLVRRAACLASAAGRALKEGEELKHFPSPMVSQREGRAPSFTLAQVRQHCIHNY